MFGAIPCPTIQSLNASPMGAEGRRGLGGCAGRVLDIGGGAGEPDRVREGISGFVSPSGVFFLVRDREPPIL
jgi:hypothetical protein